LTGGIGSGKTTVARLFAEFNVPIIDADLIARELVEPGQPALAELVEAFGGDILNDDGSLNRRRLRERVFADAGERKRLEAILHPRIRARMMDRLDEADGPYAVMVVPLLIDTGHWEMIDRILVVDVDEDTQLQRVMRRDNVDRRQAETIIDTQVSRQDRLSAADDIVENTGDMAELREQVARLHQRYMNEATRDGAVAGRADNTVIAYEQPLNERIRTFLRLEHLFTRARYHIEANTPHDAHSVIVTLVEISSLVGRGDPKSDIIKELERQNASLKRHADIPGVDQQLLKGLLNEQSECIQALHGTTEQLSRHLQQDYLFSSVRQRLNIPGGTCDFDLPVYSHWLRAPAGQRAETLNRWFAPFENVERAIGICLKVIRESADPLECVAEAGYYEHGLDGGADLQMIRVRVDAGGTDYPTISAGKHRLNVRFMQWRPGEPRSPQTEADVPFELMLCGI
jgi:dephospho-CoA kinase